MLVFLCNSNTNILNILNPLCIRWKHLLWVLWGLQSCPRHDPRSQGTCNLAEDRSDVQSTSRLSMMILWDRCSGLWGSELVNVTSTWESKKASWRKWCLSWPFSLGKMKLVQNGYKRWSAWWEKWTKAHRTKTLVEIGEQWAIECCQIKMFEDENEGEVWVRARLWRSQECCIFTWKGLGFPRRGEESSHT